MKRTDAVTGPNAAVGKQSRRYSRYSVNMKMEARVFREGAVVSLWGCCNEMGEDGMSATLTGELENGEVATLEFTLPMGTAAIKLRAVVRYRSGFRHGFEFLRVSEKQREAIRRALSVAAESG